MRAVLDTSVLMGPAPGRIEGELAISAVSLAALHLGVLAASSADVRAHRLRRLAVIEKTFDALPVDDAVARAYGRLAAALIATGRPARADDVLIAATALAHDAVLVTRHPGGLAGLDRQLEVRSLAQDLGELSE